MGSGRNKVKSGCRTCKIRKVKCDEGRPACTRCINGRRICEGYGIWGGGSTEADTTDQVKMIKVTPSEPPKIKMNREDTEWMDWFRSITTVRLQGPFKNAFWQSLVLRASLHEPSVFHASLAISALHKQIVMGVQLPGPGGEPDQVEQFTLRQYNKAIHQLLQPQFGPRNKPAIRTALVACMIFVCLEYLRGRFKTGHHHLLCGMKLLPVLMQFAGSNREPVDDDLIFIFTSVNLAAVQLGHGVPTPTAEFKPTPLPLPLLFKDLGHAREVLDRLTNDILYLEANRGDGAEIERERIKRELAAWLAVYSASKPTIQAALGPSRITSLAYQALTMRYPMIKIMAETCLREPGDEMVFDNYTADFIHLITQATQFLMAIQGLHMYRKEPIFKLIETELVHFSANLGWTPQMYYAALHCRLRSIRWRAFQLLRAFRSREGIWDAQVVASAAEEVMRMEEGVDSLQEFVAKNDLLFKFVGSDEREEDSRLETGDDLLPLPPASSRVSDVRIALPEEIVVPYQHTFTCRLKTDGGGTEEITREYWLVAWPI
ncbi:hypothetical protein QBC37DRAFT_355093 [Rhypophila decipiens]|uniref:Zn(2)-C6 fungal-type domain-containing protein n=1 Tax=Rhypophila decipiens TaxID=261697 RepID=A0AAN6XVW4_9PEZI|nr:hypothetical protein QBC37DRAFT_355093 [Rhypophila decipiens]